MTRYMPVADNQVRRFFTDCGYEVARLDGPQMRQPGADRACREHELRDAIRRVDGADLEAVVQVGTNLAMARLAGVAEVWLGKPVLAINTATYWWALRRNGIADRRDGFGSLLLQH